ncbi:MAG: MoaD/ThiS family protein [Candidatus Thorarchaeota archaeon]
MCGESSIHISVRLYNRLVTLLPPESSGRVELELPEGSTIQTVIDSLGLSNLLPVAVNGVIEKDLGRILMEGDQVSVFAPVGGG